jgi:S-adenosylmethionine:tRNA ribosyltransferase-isomerase
LTAQLARASRHDADNHVVYNRGVLVSDFHFELPEELIAQEALADRAGSRMLCVGSGGELSDRQFREFPELLRAGDPGGRWR